MNSVEIKLLKDIVKLVTGKTPPTKNEDYFNGGVFWLTPSDFKHKYVSNTERTVSQLAINDKKVNVIKNNSLFVTCIGNIGKVIINKNLCTSNQQITALEIKDESQCLVEYLYYWFIKNQKNIESKSNKAVVPIINNAILGEVEIPLPPLATQKAIAEKLDKADALRKKDQELLKQYDELAQSIFIEMFGDPVQNEKGWDLINFEEVLKLKRGYDLPVQDRNQNGNIPVYGSNGILDYHTISKTNKPCIVTGRSGTIGKVHRTEQNCWPLNTTLYSYEIYDNNITYLEYLLNNLRIDRFAHGAGVPTLDRKIVHKEFIPNIKVELQNQFAEKIKNIEAQKELVKKQAEASENLFQALLQESFSFT